MLLINCLQLVHDSPVAVTSDLSPSVVQTFDTDKRNTVKPLSSARNNVVDWERCAKEFSCDCSGWKTVSFTAGTSTASLYDADCNELRQPKARKRLASSMAGEALPSELSGKCMLLMVND